MMIDGFIFDLDGVLTDTAEYHYRAWKLIADKLGVHFSRAENDSLRGIPRRESLITMLKGRVLPEEQVVRLMEEKNSHYLEMIREITPKDILPGARELLEEIKAAGLHTALGSASKNAREVIERMGIAGLLDVISDGNSVIRQKPAPDLFLHAAGQLNLPPARCVVVEDAAAGIQAALAGGFWTLGIGPASRFQFAHAIRSDLANLKLADLQDALAHAPSNT